MDATSSFKRQYFSAKTPRCHIVKVCSVRFINLLIQLLSSIPCARSRRVCAVGRVGYVSTVRQATGSDTRYFAGKILTLYQLFTAARTSNINI